MEAIIIALAIAGLIWMMAQAFQSQCLLIYERSIDSAQFQSDLDATRDRVGLATQQLYQARRAHVPPGSHWRELVVEETIRESEDCLSLVLSDPAGDRLPPFLPGQHLLIEHSTPEWKRLSRCYSLSSDRSDGRYRITVKRNPLGTTGSSLSNRLHQLIREGDTLRAKGPQGSFVCVPEGERPIAFLAAGIGVTPLLCMAQSLLKTGNARKQVFLYQIRDLAHAPLLGELEQLATEHSHFDLHVFVSQETVERARYHQGKGAGRDVSRLLGKSDADVYLCGPDTWMQWELNSLEDAGFDLERVHWESFGSTPSEKSPQSPSSTESNVRFEVYAPPRRSPISCSADTTLLEALEREGITVDAGCRTGQCGSCVARLVRGKVQYTRKPHCGISGDQIPLCVSVPVESVELKLDGEE